MTQGTRESGWTLGTDEEEEQEEKGDQNHPLVKKVGGTKEVRP